MVWPATIRTYAAGEVVTAAKLNETRDALRTLSDSWATYAPQWFGATTNPSIGDGLLTGSYILAGKSVLAWRIVLTIGSATTLGSGAYSFSMPAAATTSMPAYSPVGQCSLYDASPFNVYLRTATLSSAGSNRCFLRDQDGNTSTHSSPVPWVAGDRIVIDGLPYETQ